MMKCRVHCIPSLQYLFRFSYDANNFFLIGNFYSLSSLEVTQIIVDYYHDINNRKIIDQKKNNPVINKYST